MAKPENDVVGEQPAASKTGALAYLHQMLESLQSEQGKIAFERTRVEAEEREIDERIAALQARRAATTSRLEEIDRLMNRNTTVLTWLSNVIGRGKNEGG